MKYNFLLLLVLMSALLLMNSCETHELTDASLLVPLTVEEDPSLPAISVNGTRLHSETFGDPSHPMIVVVHGGPGADYRSLLNCQAFAEDGFFVVFYDQRGSGLSQRHDAEVYAEVQLFIDDLEAVIEHYRYDADQEIILMGHSWGAMLATAYINQHPNAIHKVILMEPGGFTWEDTQAYISRFMTLSLFGEITNDFFYPDQLLTGHDHATLDYRFMMSGASDFAEGNQVGNIGPTPLWRAGAVCNQASIALANEHPFDFTTHLDQYTTEVLFIYSELNVAYGKAHAELVSSAYPSVQLVRVDGTGHEIPHSGWENYYPIAQTYLIQ